MNLLYKIPDLKYNVNMLENKVKEIQSILEDLEYIFLDN